MFFTKSNIFHSKFVQIATTMMALLVHTPSDALAKEQRLATKAYNSKVLIQTPSTMQAEEKSGACVTPLGEWPDQATFCGYTSNGSSFVRNGFQRLGTSLWDNQTWLAGDFDGDGFDDVAQIYPDPNGKTSVFVYNSDGVLLNRSPVERLNANFSENHFWKVGDFNNDGLDDLVLVYGHSKYGATAWIYTSNGAGFSRTHTQRMNAKFWDSQRWETGDFNNDGFDDLVLVYGQSKYGATAWIYTSNGNSFSRTHTQRLNAKFWDSQRWETGDFNGDGLDDLVLVYGHSKYGATAWIYSSNGDGFSRTHTQRMDAKFWDSQRWETGDFNGDGLDDLVLIYGHAKYGATAWTYSSNTSAFEKTNTQRLNTRFRDTQRWLPADLDGDGLDGLALFYADPKVESALPELGSAKAAIVIEQSTGRVLGVKDPDKRRAMASTTKMMTGLLVVERLAAGTLDLNTIVTVSRNAGTMGDMGSGDRAGGSIMGDLGDNNNDGFDDSVGLTSGDTVSIQDLLYGMLLDSGNDAAIALAEAVAGEERDFVALMNNRAEQLGLHNTRFANPHGRDPQRIDRDCPEVDFDDPQADPQCVHYSTARDLAKLARVALAQTLFETVVGTRNYRTENWNSQNPDNVDFSPDNSNKMIRTDRTEFRQFWYPGAFGVKTGTTDRAGRCLVSAANAQDTASGSVIAVVLGAAADTDDDNRYTDSATVLDFGFQSLTSVGGRSEVYTQTSPSTGVVSP